MRGLSDPWVLSSLLRHDRDSPEPDGPARALAGPSGSEMVLPPVLIIVSGREDYFAGKAETIAARGPLCACPRGGASALRRTYESFGGFIRTSPE
jgi:hypothetical protein